VKFIVTCHGIFLDESWCCYASVHSIDGAEGSMFSYCPSVCVYVHACVCVCLMIEAFSSQLAVDF